MRSNNKKIKAKNKDVNFVASFVVRTGEILSSFLADILSIAHLVIIQIKLRIAHCVIMKTL